MVRDARRSRAPHHEGPAAPHPEERALARVSKDVDTASEILRDMNPPSRDAMRPSCAKILLPSKAEGAGKAGCAMHPQPRVEINKPHELVTTVAPEKPGIPARKWF